MKLGKQGRFQRRHHTGLFAVAPAAIDAYRDKFDPLCLRHGAGSGNDLNLPFVTFGAAKGRAVEHVLIYPTEKIRAFLTPSVVLEGRTACALYIGITRAQHSVAFIVDPDDAAALTRWQP